MPLPTEPDASNPSDAPHSGDHLVHEAVGSPLTGLQAAATLGVGINSLMVLGILPVLLGSLQEEHRLSASGMGLTAMIETLAMGLSTAGMGLIRRPNRLRLIAVSASLGLAVADVASMTFAGSALMVARAVAGAVEGVLLWIAVAMIARTVTPERWAGAFFTTQTLAQLLLAVALALWIAPRFGANGAFAALAACSLVGVIPALMAPRSFAPLNVSAQDAETPPLRGWYALAATLVFVSAGGAVSIYLQPLAIQAGLDAGAARTAVWVSLVAQVLGGALATSLAGRVRYYAVFAFSTVVYLAIWALFAHAMAGWLFLAANALAGFVALLIGPFLVPMLIDADPSRRAAMQSGAAQLLGGAMGPLLASWVVGDSDVRGVLWLGAGLLLAGFAGMTGLRFIRPGVGGEA